MSAVAAWWRSLLGESKGSGSYLPVLPTLWPRMLLGGGAAVLPFPFSAEGVRYHYLERNAIWTAAKLAKLTGREVLVPAYHHGAEIEALVAAGVTPRFYGVGRDLRLDPEEIISQIGPNTAAVFVIHYLGFPQPLERLAQACRNRGLWLIEDCALALLSQDREQPLGTRGDLSLFCLYKTLPLPHGAVLAINRGLPRGSPIPEAPPSLTSWIQLGRMIVEHLGFRSGAGMGRWATSAVMSVARRARGRWGPPMIPVGNQHFSTESLGLGMASVAERIIRAQDFTQIVERRRRNFFFLSGRLRDVSEPLVQELPPGVCPLFYPLLVPEKDHVRSQLARRGVDTIDFWRVGHPAVRPGEFPEVERLRREVIELPIHQDLEPVAMTVIADAVREVLHERPTT